MNKRDVPGRLINEPEQFDFFFSKVQLLFNLKEQCGVVVLLLNSAQDSCPGHLNKTSIGGVCCHQRPARAVAMCVERERTLRGLSGCRISPAQLFGVDAFSVCWKSWCPKLLPETWSLIEALVKSFFPKCLFSILVHQMETAALWLTQTFAVWDKNSHPFVRERHHCALLFPDYI